jgi:hypothetical protein
MKQFREIFRVFLNKLSELLQGQATLTLSSTRLDMIINPRLTSSKDQVIVPAQYKFTPEEVLDIVVQREYINVRPARKYSVEGGR